MLINLISFGQKLQCQGQTAIKSITISQENLQICFNYQYSFKTNRKDTMESVIQYDKYVYSKTSRFSMFSKSNKFFSPNISATKQPDIPHGPFRIQN